jgi:small subunit ribosomal protein S18
MARGNDRERKRAPKDDRRRGGKKKVCIFCKEHMDWVDYKDVNLLRRFMSDRGKIRARRVTGNCSQHQRDVATAIKLSRELALLPYLTRTTTERGGGRGPRPPRGEPRGAAVVEDELPEELLDEEAGDEALDVEVDVEAGIEEAPADEEVEV